MLIPIEMTIQRASPCKTEVPLKSAFWVEKSNWETSLNSSLFSTDSDSPVKQAWLTYKESEFNSRIIKSAGIMSPVLTKRMSPGTKNFDSIFLS